MVGLHQEYPKTKFTSQEIFPGNLKFTAISCKLKKMLVEIRFPWHVFLTGNFKKVTYINLWTQPKHFKKVKKDTKNFSSFTH